ncbi:MAG: hypothetical protein GC160_12715 [Acidobacteria bacterium]|nr:hypothetical protein [Acidobacteriota bacterium]
MQTILRRLSLVVAFSATGWLALTAERSGVEACELHRGNLAEAPSGKEADGIAGDFVLRNDEIELLIGGNQPLRRPNMKILPEHPTPGSLYDLDRRGAGNDQLTAFRPGAEKGAVSFVRLAEPGPGGERAVETVRTAALGEGLGVTHRYGLRPGARHVEIDSTWTNESAEPRKIDPRPAWHGLDNEARAGAVRTGDSVDPFDKRGYAWAPLEPAELPDALTLQPGESATVRLALAVAGSPLEAYGVIADLLGPALAVSGRAVDREGRPALHGAVFATVAGTRLTAYPDAEGRYAFRLPPGAYEVTFEDLGRPSQTKRVELSRSDIELDWDLPPASRVEVTIRDAEGRPSPGKVQFLGEGSTPNPDFGTPRRAHGASHQYQTHDGRFEQQIPPGDYLLRVTLGPGYDLFEQRISVPPGESVRAEARLERVVDTTGWVSTDFHAHSTPSGDNYCRTEDRLINLAAEHIEFAPTTEHNRIYDWQPLIDRLGLGDRIRTIPGIELTGWGQHFNAFPLRPDPAVQNGGAPMWQYDPRLTAIVLRDWNTPTLGGEDQLDIEANANARRGAPVPVTLDRWVQANHPDVQHVFFDRDQDGVADGGFQGFERLIDAAEVWSAEILNPQPYVESPRRPGRRFANRTFYWLQMLKQGRHVWCVAVSDAHGIFGGGVGAWRTYAPSSHDEPGAIDPAEIIRNAKAGQMMITNGPFLTVETADGRPIGSTIHAEGFVDLKVKVQAANWIDVDRVQVLVNGRMPAARNFTARTHPSMFRPGVVRFEQTIRVPLQEDAHLIVAAVGENASVSKGWGLNPQGRMRPTAYTNPVYVDVGHDGFRANGDTLGHPLPVWRDGD